MWNFWGKNNYFHQICYLILRQNLTQSPIIALYYNESYNLISWEVGVCGGVMGKKLFFSKHFLFTLTL